MKLYKTQIQKNNFKSIYTEIGVFKLQCLDPLIKMFPSCAREIAISPMR